MDTKILKELKRKLDKGNPVPLYYQLEKTLEEMIVHGIILPGERLAGDVELSAFLAVNGRTVRKALAGLVEKGLITRIRKAGTFVREKEEQCSPTVGFFYFKEAEGMMVKVAEYIQLALSHRGYDLKIIPFHKDYYENIDLSLEMGKKGLKGAILVTMPGERCRAAIKNLDKRKVPYVRFGNAFFTGELKAPLVRGNDRQATRDAIAHLWRLGHREIGLICNYRGWEPEQEYRAFYGGKGCRLEERWRMSIEFSGPLEQWQAMPGPQIVRGYLAANPDITALMVEHLPVCIEVFRQADLVGRRIPEDVSVMCLRTIPDSRLDPIHPQLDAMLLPLERMAEEAVEQLLRIFRNGFPDREEVIMMEHPFRPGETVCTVSGNARKNNSGKILVNA